MRPVSTKFASSTGSVISADLFTVSAGADIIQAKPPSIDASPSHSHRAGRRLQKKKSAAAKASHAATSATVPFSEYAPTGKEKSTKRMRAAIPGSVSSRKRLTSGSSHKRLNTPHQR